MKIKQLLETSSNYVRHNQPHGETRTFNIGDRVKLTVSAPYPGEVGKVSKYNQEFKTYGVKLDNDGTIFLFANQIEKIFGEAYEDRPTKAFRVTYINKQNPTHLRFDDIKAIDADEAREVANEFLGKDDEIKSISMKKMAESTDEDENNASITNKKFEITYFNPHRASPGHPKVSHISASSEREARLNLITQVGPDIRITDIKEITDEARVPGLDYKEEIKSKKDPQIDKVVLKLESKDSEIMTKLANRYKKLDNLSKMIKEQRDSMNDTVKSKMGELFDAEDVFITRVIETVSATMTLARQGEKIPASVQTVTHWDKIGQELFALVEGELLEKAKILLEKYTEVQRLPAQEPRSPALTVKSSSLKEAFSWDSLKTWAGKFLDYFKSWGRSYDQKLAKIVGEMQPIVEAWYDFGRSGESNEEIKAKLAKLPALIKYAKEAIDKHDMTDSKFRDTLIDKIEHEVGGPLTFYMFRFQDMFKQTVGKSFNDYVQDKIKKQSVTEAKTAKSDFIFVRTPEDFKRLHYSIVTKDKPYRRVITWKEAEQYWLNNVYEITPMECAEIAANGGCHDYDTGTIIYASKK